MASPLVLKFCVGVFILVLTIILFRRRKISCKWKEHGCKHAYGRQDLALHEDKCAYRLIQCPAFHRGTCPWIGSLSHLVEHSREKQCIQFLKAGVNQPFKSFIGDYARPDLTVFKQIAGSVHWKPVFLIGEGVSEYLIYLVIHRSREGNWFLIPRSYSPKRFLQQLKIKIELYKAPPSTTTWIPMRIMWEGKIASSTLTAKQAEDARLVMKLHDVHIRALVEGEKLFEYRVHVLKC